MSVHDELTPLDIGNHLPVHVPHPAGKVLAVIDGHEIDRDSMKCLRCGATWAVVVSSCSDSGSNCKGVPCG